MLTAAVELCKPQDQMEMLFNFYDVDGDGTLSLEEFKLACQVPAHPRAAIHPMSCLSREQSPKLRVSREQSPKLRERGLCHG